MPEIVNLVRNPSAEVDSNSDGLSDGWYTRGSGTLSRVASPWGPGMAQQIVVKTAGQDTGWSIGSNTDMIPCTGGQTITLVARHSGPEDRGITGFSFYKTVPLTMYVSGTSPV